MGEDVTFSANLGFLYTELNLVDRIYAAKHDGFDALECHFPYDTPAALVKAALNETGLTMLGLNTVPGDVAAGDFGLCALPDRIADARAAIDQAIAYGAEIGALNVHVMAGRTYGAEGAEDAFRANLTYACDAAAKHGLSILIEPINQRDVAGYHLSTVEHARAIIDDLKQPNLRMMFDCYHTQIMQGDLTTRLKTHLPVIGHIQIAAVPDRGEPDQGEVHYINMIRAIRKMGYTAPIGAEYKPRTGSTTDGLGWLAAFKKELS